MLELTEVKTCELTNLFKAVNESVSMNEELTRGLGNIKVILEEALNGHKCFTVEALERALLEYFLEEHFAKSRRKLINKTADAEIFIAYDILFCVKYLADLDSNLCFLKGTCKIADILNGGTDTYGNLCIELSAKCINNALSELFDRLHVNGGLDFLDKSNIILAYADDVVLILIGEQVLNHLIRNDFVLSVELDKKDDTYNVVAEMKLLGLRINIGRKNVIKNYVLNERSLVVLVVVKTLYAAEGNCEN